jgi:predicted GNAT superfamily acetyltransferase
VNSPAGKTIAIRKMVSVPEMEACVGLQQAVWKFQDLDVIPRRMFVVANSIGGQVLGAWEDTQLVGFILAVPGVRDGQPYLHSHMLAVLPEYRNRGIGRMLKLAQRKDALAQGIDLIEWTFDPMEVKNAYFNIEKLGAVVRRYTPDFYGSSTSPLHGALPTDRLHAEWWLKSERVRTLIAGQDLQDSSIQATITVPNREAASGDTLHPLPALALESLLEVRRSFLTSFSAGLTVLRFQNLPDESARYRLGLWDEPAR